MTATPAFPGVRIHVVTGKGGTGKTTVAAALAMGLARRGQRVLLAEVEGRQGIAQTFDVPPLSTQEVRVLADRSGGEVWGLSVDAKAALLEYLQTFYKLGRAGSVLERVGAIDFATTIAPGVRDVLLIGKVYEAVGRTTGSKRGRGDLSWDAVVLDAPPSGRIGRFLNVNAEVADVARVGPIRSQADSITRLLRSPRTAVHAVTLLEEMPVQETVDAIGEIAGLGMPVGAIVVNQVREPLLGEAGLARVAKAAGSTRSRKALVTEVTAALGATGIRRTTALVDGLISEATDHADRIALEADQREVVAEAGRPAYDLPWLPDGVEGGGLRLLADLLVEQGMA
ncbi:MAG: ArsA-related P-loop ATPase [Nostocoides sp.]